MPINDDLDQTTWKLNKQLFEDFKEMLKDDGSNKSYLIYTRDDCPFCKLAVDLLERKNKQYVKEIIRLDEKDNWKEKVSKELGQEITTFPVIFLGVNDDLTYIGGYDDLEHHLHKEHLALIKF